MMPHSSLFLFDEWFASITQTTSLHISGVAYHS